MTPLILTGLLSTLLALPIHSNSQVPIADARVTVEDLSFQVRSGAISFIEIYPSDTAIFTLFPSNRTLSEAYGTLTPISSAINLANTSFAAGISAQNTLLTQSVFIRTTSYGEPEVANEDLWGFIASGHSSGALNLRLAPNTNVILSFSAIASTYTSLPPGNGIAVSDLQVNLGGNTLYLASCSGSTNNGDCSGLLGIPDRASVVWELSSGEAQYDTYFRLQASAATIGVSAVPEVHQVGLWFVGIVFLLATRIRRSINLPSAA